MSLLLLPTPSTPSSQALTSTKVQARSLLTKAIAAYSRNEDGQFTTRVMDDPALYLFVMENSTKGFSCAQYRKTLKKVVSSGNFDEPILADMLIKRMNQLGRKQWPFQKKLRQKLAKDLLACLKHEEEDEFMRTMIESVDYLNNISLCNGEIACMNATSARNCAMEFERRLYVAFPQSKAIAFFCQMYDFCKYQRPAVYANEMANRVAGKDMQKEFILTVRHDGAGAILEACKNAKPGEVISYGVLPFIPPQTAVKRAAEETMYLCSFCLPADGLLYQWAIVVDRLENLVFIPSVLFAPHPGPHF